MRVTVLALVGVVALSLTTGAWADEPAALASADRDVLMQRIDRLEATIRDMQARDTASMDEVRMAQMEELVRDVMKDSEFRESLFPDAVQVGYDSGFFICNPDDTYELKIGGVQQFRYVFYNAQSTNHDLAPGVRRRDRSGFENTATHLWFVGHLFGKQLTYRVQGVWGNNTPNFAVFYTFLNYEVSPELNILAGLFKVPFGHQELQGAPLQMFAERGMANETFNLDRSVGVQLWGNVMDKKLHYRFAVVNGFQTPYASIKDRDIAGVARQLDQNPAFAARLVYRAMGSMGAGDSDLQYHEDPALQVGLSAAYNDNNGDAASGLVSPFKFAQAVRAATGLGAYGRAGFVGDDVTQLGADAQFKWKGFAATAEYYLRIIDASDNANAFSSTGIETVHQQGGEIQVGYFLIPKKLEAVARLGGVWDVGPGNECTVEYACGMNYYFAGHNNKLQFDVTKVDELPVVSQGGNYINLNDDITMFRLQWQVMF